MTLAMRNEASVVWKKRDEPHVLQLPVFEEKQHCMRIILVMDSADWWDNWSETWWVDHNCCQTPHWPQMHLSFFKDGKQGSNFTLSGAMSLHYKVRKETGLSLTVLKSFFKLFSILKTVLNNQNFFLRFSGIILKFSKWCPLFSKKNHKSKFPYTSSFAIKKAGLTLPTN